MEKDFWSLLLQSNAQMPNPKSSAQPFDLGLRSANNAAPGVNNTVSTKGNCPVNELPLPLKAKEPHGWFYRLPHFRQSFNSGANMFLDEKLLPSRELPKQARATASGCSPKQFLVFDQSGNKTSLIYSSGTGAPVCLNSWNSNSRSPYFRFNNSDAVKFDTRSEKHNLSGANMTDELNAAYTEAEVKSEMHEDSEEINALLYSDDENDHEEDDYDEETMSTGHSPSVMTAYNDDKQGRFEEDDREEVASSGGPMKRRRIFHGGYDQSLLDTASSARADTTFEHEDDAESKHADDHGRFLSYNDDNPMCRIKRSREDRIREAVEILRTIVPGWKNKDSVVILDESIRYLKSLKLKAVSLGLTAL